MSDEQRRIILHALGIELRGQTRRQRWSYRNRYRETLPAPWYLVLACEAGWMEPGGMTNNCTERYYRVTRAGAEAAGVLHRCRREDVPR